MTGNVECVSCALFTLREAPKFAQLGLGQCAAMKGRPGTFVSPQFPRQCRDHQPAPAATTAARIEWLCDVRSEGA